MDSQPFYAHADLISRYSGPLEALMKNPMKEKEQEYAVLEEVTPDTFNRFLQWVYHGFYSAPYPKAVDASSPPSPDTSAVEEANEVRIGGSVDVPASEAIEVDIGKPVELDFDWSGFGSKTKDKKARKNEDCCCSQFSSSSRQNLRQAFISRSYEAFRSAVPIPPARRNENENEDYADVFLGHARLYVFANNYLIHDLKTLALENLHETLKIFELYSYRTGDIISLFRYVYGNTQIPDNGKTEPMRSLLAEYVGFEMDILMKDLAFRDLMIEDGILDTAQRQSLLDDYMAAVMKRI